MAAIPEALARFEREAVAAARITHENIANALDFGQLPDGSFYLVMEYVPGQLLRDALGQGAMAPERVVHIGTQIASALAAAHAAGIVHRDLKPENVILTSRQGTSDHVKVLDLGIAKVPIEQGSAGPALTRAGAVLGTPQYMAPEQGLGGVVDHRADLYALGVVLYEMAAGTPPFSDDDGAVAAIARHLTETPPPLPASVPATLASLILKLLQKRAEERPQSAAEVADRLQGALAIADVAPVVAVPPATQPAPRAGWSRNKVAAIAAMLLLLALATLGMTRPEQAVPATEGLASVPSAKPAAIAPAAAARPATAPEPATPPPATPGDKSPPAAKQSKNKPKKGRAKREERQTGPGGIYIPPPKDWF
jgi:serine/threonine-protein kinase